MAGIFTHRLGAFNPAAGGGGSDPHFANVVFLSGFDGTNGQTTFTDESGYARAITQVGSAQISTAQSKFGGSSLLLNGSTDAVTCADSADLEIGSGSFTVEGFVYINSLTNFNFISHNDDFGNGWTLRRESGSLSFAAGGAGTVGSAWTPSTGVWIHLAADVDAVNAIARTYVDGALFQKTTGRTFPASNGNTVLAIGKEAWRASRFLNGYVDEVRITQGVARYASDSGFTVPTAPYPRS